MPIMTSPTAAIVIDGNGGSTGGGSGSAGAGSAKAGCAGSASGSGAVTAQPAARRTRIAPAAFAQHAGRRVNVNRSIIRTNQQYFDFRVAESIANVIEFGQIRNRTDTDAVPLIVIDRDPLYS